ncbi:MAG: aminopeptidase P family protein [Saprospiraceae bacterium]|nr:aminopeptidase P family protein [Saprospiraceae bacterium]
MNIPDRLIALRQQMQQHHIDAIIIPSSDSHQSEYVAAHWQSRVWISGFTGSAGTVALSATKAGLWTDSRYWIQAEEQLRGTGIELHKQINRAQPTFLKWAVEQIPENGKIAIDGRQLSESEYRMYARLLKSRNIELVTDLDLVGAAWPTRPQLPDNPIFEHPTVYAGKSREEKLLEVRNHMERLRVPNYLLTGLDDIAWLFNLRGTDVACNPVFYAYASISPDNVTLFVDAAKVPNELRKELAEAGIELRPYDSILEFCTNFPEGQVLTQPTSLNRLLYQALPPKQIIEGPNIVRHLKAIKNETEINHLKEAMRKDGVALLRLFRWLDKMLDAGEAVTEVQVAEQLDQFRAAQSGYHGESFNAIVGYQGNGAIVHYHAMPETCATIKKAGVLLLDSGGQYIDGTTDITRTVALGPVGEKTKLAYTLVLQGHIALANIRFPEGTNGAQLDPLARMYLWNHGMNYGHGTGHGVGFFLNVHEPPQGFVASAAGNGLTPFKVGMLTSNEPGYYEANEFGIRIENLVVCVPDRETPSGNFLKFDTITYFPIELDMVKKDMLSSEEIDWINNYHQMVYQELASRVSEEEKAWLKTKCAAI